MKKLYNNEIELKNVLLIKKKYILLQQPETYSEPYLTCKIELFEKIATESSSLLSQKALSQMFGKVLNTPLSDVILLSTLSFWK